jgi:hypothetical protein
MDIENQSILQAKPENKTHTPNLSNGDTVKQLLLARSIYFINPEETGPLTKKKEPSCYLSYILI